MCVCVYMWLVMVAGDQVTNMWVYCKLVMVKAGQVTNLRVKLVMVTGDQVSHSTGAQGEQEGTSVIGHFGFLPSHHLDIHLSEPKHQPAAVSYPCRF